MRKRIPTSVWTSADVGEHVFAAAVCYCSEQSAMSRNCSHNCVIVSTEASNCYLLVIAKELSSNGRTWLSLTCIDVDWITRKREKYTPQMQRIQTDFHAFHVIIAQTRAVNIQTFMFTLHRTQCYCSESLCSLSFFHSIQFIHSSIHPPIHSFADTCEKFEKVSKHNIPWPC